MIIATTVRIASRRGRKGRNGRQERRVEPQVNDCYNRGLIMTENQLGKRILDFAFEIHTELGPGLLETVYEVVLAHELRGIGLEVERQKPVPIVYRGLSFDEGFRADLIVENKVIVELKSVEALKRVHAKQVLTQLRLTNLRLGYLINFGEEHLKHGIKRLANRLVEPD
jgi:GxxExxY protein